VGLGKPARTRERKASIVAAQKKTGHSLAGLPGYLLQKKRRSGFIFSTSKKLANSHVSYPRIAYPKKEEARESGPPSANVL
jgi:hypothetical protein